MTTSSPAPPSRRGRAVRPALHAVRRPRVEVPVGDVDVAVVSVAAGLGVRRDLAELEEAVPVGVAEALDAPLAVTPKRSPFGANVSWRMAPRAEATTRAHIPAGTKC